MIFGTKPMQVYQKYALGLKLVNGKYQSCQKVRQCETDNQSDNILEATMWQVFPRPQERCDNFPQDPQEMLQVFSRNHQKIVTSFPKTPRVVQLCTRTPEMWQVSPRTWESYILYNWIMGNFIITVHQCLSLSLKDCASAQLSNNLMTTRAAKKLKFLSPQDCFPKNRTSFLKIPSAQQVSSRPQVCTEFSQDHKCAPNFPKFPPRTQVRNKFPQGAKCAPNFPKFPQEQY